MQSSLEKKVNPCYLGFPGKICPFRRDAQSQKTLLTWGQVTQAAHL